MRVVPRSIILLSACGLAAACGHDTTEPAPGALELTLSTTGHDLDPDGYTITLDSGQPIPVPTNGTVSLPDLSPGPHTMTLAGLATNCTPGTPTAVQVSIPQDSRARFEVTCSAIYTLAYHGAAGIELTNAAGTVHRTLVPDAKPLDWSPDGRLLALVRYQDNDTILWVSVADSGNFRQLTSVHDDLHVTHIFAAEWSPDGRDLLYEVQGGPNSLPSYLARVALDGSFDGSEHFGSAGTDACQALMPGGAAPDWSPDGSEIVVHRPVHQGGLLYQPGLYVLNRDGTAQRFLAQGQQPDWSPDGSAIVYVAGPSSCHGGGLNDLQRYGSASLHLIGPDGSNDRQLTSPAPDQTDEKPAWSPDGSQVTFLRLSVAPDSVVTSVHAYLIDADGTNEHELAVLPLASVGSMPSWSPDGLHLAFAGDAGTYVVNADGSDFHLVTAFSTCCVPARWRP